GLHRVTGAAELPGDLMTFVEGAVRGLGRHYRDGTPQLEIHVPVERASDLPFEVGTRVPIDVQVGVRKYSGGLRATQRNPQVWICPALLDAAGERISLGRVLIDAGLPANSRVRLTVDGTSITVALAAR